MSSSDIMEVSLSNTENQVDIEAITGWLFRLRIKPRHTVVKESALRRYGVLKSDWPSFDYIVEKSEIGLQRISTKYGTLEVDATGSYRLLDARGNCLTQSIGEPEWNINGAFSFDVSLDKDDHLYGLGDETRDRIEKRGHDAKMWVRNVQCYAPTPWLMSSQGWAMFLSTTWKHRWDVGSQTNDQVHIWCAGGELDLYLIVGHNLPTLLDRGTQLMGRPALLPLWGYGLTFVCNEQSSARDYLDDCMIFRRENIPCDTLGLEPGWMSKHYDATTEKQWHPERFAIPAHCKPGSPRTFLAASQRLGFKTSLWLCCEYDLSEEEERLISPTGRVEHASNERIIDPDDYEQDQHLDHPQRYMNPNSKPGEAWFEHLKKFVDQGAQAFKLDGAWQVNDHPDWLYANGMTDLEMHNLYPTLLNKQMSNGFRDHTNLRPMIYSSGAYAGIAQYSATWAGDTGGRHKVLVSILNHSMSGHTNTSCDMDLFSAEGIHFGFFQPWPQINSYAYWTQPWLLGEELLSVFRSYVELRYRLLPYIYSMSYKAHRTGMPLMRPMPLAFPNEPRRDELMYQYGFGDAFLTGAFTKILYLPEGQWIDYWTGKEYKGPTELPVDPPDGKGGMLLVRAGAIIPYWPQMQYVGQKPVNRLGLHVYPGPESSFDLFEDDGTTLGYLQGRFAITAITQRTNEQSLTLEIPPREGEYDGMPETRSFDVTIHLADKPTNVSINGKLTEWTHEHNSLRVHIKEDPSRRKMQRLIVTR